MCGMCGYVGLDDKTLLSSMSQAIKHRGQKEDTFTDTGIGLCVRHFGEESQLLFSKDGPHVIAWSGDSHFASMTSLLEIMFARYSNWGEARKGLEDLRGRFSFAAWDSNLGCITLARDHLGISPVYYLHSDHELFFASEIKSLLRVTDSQNRKVNSRALSRYLACGYVFGEETLLEHVMRVPAGGVVQFGLKDKRPTVDRYWTLRKLWSEPRRTIVDMKNAEQLVFSGILDAIAVRVAHESEPFSILSGGGLDSGTVAALLTKILRLPVTCYTVMYENEKLNEPYAESVAEWLQCDLKKIWVEARDSIDFIGDLALAYDDLVGEAAASLATLIAMKEVSVGSKVLLTGDGGDEIFWGYPWEWYLEVISSKWAHLPYAARSVFDLVLRGIPRPPISLAYARALNLAPSLGSEGRFTCLPRVFVGDHLRRTLCHSAVNDDVEAPLAVLAMSVTTDNMSKRYFLCLEALTRRFGVSRTEPISASCGVTLLTPFLDHKLVSLASQLDPSLKQKGPSTKRVMRHMLLKRQLLPPEVVRQKKRGFAVREWMGKEFQEFACQQILDNVKQLKSFFNMKYVVEMLRSRKLSIDEINALLLFRLWYEKIFSL